jgi:hypothetical protein
MKPILSVAAAAVALCFMTPTSQAQSSHLRLRFYVPFSFSVSNQTFSAGEYEFTQQTHFVFEVYDLKDHASAFETVQPAQLRTEGNGRVRLVFHRYDNQYFLTAVSDGSWESTYDFKTSTEEKLLARANPRKPVMIVSIDPGGAVLVASRSQN